MPSCKLPLKNMIYRKFKCVVVLTRWLTENHGANDETALGGFYDGHSMR